MNFGYIVLMTPVIASLFLGHATGGMNGSNPLTIAGINEETRESETVPRSEESIATPDSNPAEQSGDGVVSTVERPAEPDRPSEPSIEELLAKHFGKHAGNAAKIMKCESGGKPDRHNYNDKTRDDSWGLFQVNRYGRLAATRPPASELVKPEVNIEYAAGIFYSEGERFGTTRGWFNCAKKLGIR